MEQWQQEQQEKMLQVMHEKRRDYIYDLVMERIERGDLRADEIQGDFYLLGQDRMLLQDCVLKIEAATKTKAEILHAVDTITENGFETVQGFNCEWSYFNW